MTAGDGQPGLPPFQLKMARMFFALPASKGFLLAGGAALLAQHLTARPTEDLDFFTAPERGHVPAARDGVSLRLGEQVEAIEDGRVRLAGETSAEGDVILVAGGVEPEVGIAAGAGIAIEAGRVQVDAGMRSSVAGVLAAGDVAFAFNAAAGRRLSVERWGDGFDDASLSGR